jgi:hypothetical protein
VLHESVGHLGIFVGGEVARKEHDQLVASLAILESLPPGLYEMRLQAKDARDVQRWDSLEPGDYTVHYEHRTMQDILALNPEGRDEEALFSTIAKVSEFNAQCYKTLMRPWVKAMASRGVGDAIGGMHPLRLQRQLLSDASPAAPFIRGLAAQVRARRKAADPDNPLREVEQRLDATMTALLHAYRDQRDAYAVRFALAVYGPAGFGRRALSPCGHVRRNSRGDAAHPTRSGWPARSRRNGCRRASAPAGSGAARRGVAATTGRLPRGSSCAASARRSRR